ncbi:MAG: DMT family transporter [Clostridiales bacterium]|nr:DMT family transporter [Clostridiales bacterium]
MNKSTRANLLLLLTALIWGVAFVAQDVASGSLDPFIFNGLRMALAALALLPVVYFTDKKAQQNHTADTAVTGNGVSFAKMTPAQKKTLLLGSLCCGIMLTLGSVFQQTGINMGTSAGKAGFITALYIVLVPLLGLLWGKRVRWLLWVAVAISAVGLYLLCIKEGFTIEPGDSMLILCAFSFTGHILVVDHFSPRTDCIKMSCIQFAITAVLCLILSAIFEVTTLADVRAALIPLLYAGIMSGAVGYTLQIVAQKDTNPTIASLIMSLESVFAVLAGWAILGDQLSTREYLGCLAMLGGIILAQQGANKSAKLPPAPPSIDP